MSHVPDVIVISIRSTPGTLDLTLDGYERDDAALESDANWICARARVSLGNFVGETPLAITTSDLARLRGRASALLDGNESEVRYETEEGILKMSASIGHTGVGRLMVDLLDSMHEGVFVRVTMDVDRTTMSDFVRDLDRAIVQFPVVRPPK
jgi:hypothetical protein